MIVLDTNVVSELMRREPAPRLLRWLAARTAAEVFTTSITEGEILYGIALLPAGKKRRGLEATVSAVLAPFEGRVLDFDSVAARAFAEIAAARRTAGRPISLADAQIAGITRALGAELATRNVDDFTGCGIDVIDPWSV